jgi:hypothetical protein
MSIVAATAVALLLTGCSSSATTPSPATPPTSTVTQASAQGWLAPAGTWDLPPDTASAVLKAGLTLDQEMLQVHYHTHLDVIVDGNAVTVPQYLGIDQQAGKLAPLHTHTPDGIIHIESPKDVPFHLGQVFTEWGQSLTAAQVGPVSLGTDKALHVFVNGTEVTTDPAQILLKSHDEIVVWVGPKGTTPQVPSTFAWSSSYPQGTDSPGCGAASRRRTSKVRTSVPSTPRCDTVITWLSQVRAVRAVWVR